MPNERNLTKQVQAYLKKLKDQGHPVWWRKNFGGGHGAGFASAHTPDITGVVAGRFFAIELKSPELNNPLTGLTLGQKVALVAIQRAGGAILVSNNMDEVRGFIGNLLTDQLPVETPNKAHE